MKIPPLFAAAGLGDKHGQLLRKVDEMETRGTRTAACCKEPIKELKQLVAIPARTAQGMKAILGSVKLQENDIHGG